MGRALLIVMCTVIFTLMSENTSVKMEGRAAEWNDFTTQYSFLIDDGKYKLAERLLNNRIPEMKQYLQTLPVQQKETWGSLVMPLMEGKTQTLQSDAGRFITYVEAVNSDKPSEYVHEELYNFREYLQSHPFHGGQVLDEWYRILPILPLGYKEKEVENLSSSISTLNKRDTFDARQEVVIQLDRLLEEESSTVVQDAFLWTAAIIGGTIMLTLIYVGLRKFKAERRERNSHERENI